MSLNNTLRYLDKLKNKKCYKYIFLIFTIPNSNKDFINI